MLNIIDASGSHDFYAMRDLYVRQADAFLLVFAINDPKSFDEVVRLREQIQSNNLKNAPVIIVANKIDIETEFRQVLLNSAAEFSGTHDTLLAECYVDDYKSVLDVFSRLMKQLPAVDGNLDLIKRRRQSMPNVHLTAEANKKCKRKRKCLIS